jgi:hypothetical protein
MQAFVQPVFTTVDGKTISNASRWPKGKRPDAAISAIKVPFDHADVLSFIEG